MPAGHDLLALWRRLSLEGARQKSSREMRGQARSLSCGNEGEALQRNEAQPLLPDSCQGEAAPDLPHRRHRALLRWLVQDRGSPGRTLCPENDGLRHRGEGALLPIVALAGAIVFGGFYLFIFLILVS